MRLLNYYITKNLARNDFVFEYFLSTLKDSIFTWDYFVDFDKSINNANKIKNELNKLNSLIGLSHEEIDTAFIDLLKSEPLVKKALPILIAIREPKLKYTPVIGNLDTLDSEHKAYLFNPKTPFTHEVEVDLKNFFELSGLKSFFENTRVGNLYDYCVGIEVGMDTNARKNRTGTSMENLVENFLSLFCDKKGYRYISQATHSKIKSRWGITIEVDKINRRFDFAIIDTKNQLYLFEVNYYGGGGSKLKATAGEYKEVHNMLSPQAINFIWITDGLGWTTAKTALHETFLHNDYVINLEMISDGILDEIII